MPLKKLWLESIRGPKKIAAFRIVPIGKIIQTVFILITLYALLAYFLFSAQDLSFSTDDTTVEFAQRMAWIPYIVAFVLQFIIATFLLFSWISIVAGIGLLFGELLKKNSPYRQLWRSSAMAFVWPFLFGIVLFILNVPSIWAIGVISLIHITYLIWSLKYYPKKRIVSS